MNNKGNIAIVILAAIGLVVLLILGIYAQQQLVHTGPVNPGRQTAPSDDVDTSGPGETKDSTTVTETTPVTDPPEETEPETEPLRPTQPTEPPETTPPATDPPETVTQETQPPEPTEDSGMHEDEFPPVPLG